MSGKGITMSENTRSLILNHEQVSQKVRRIAYEIYENNFSEKSIVLAGVTGHGYKLAENIGTMVEEISPIKVKVVKVNIDKENPDHAKVNVAPMHKGMKCIVLVDDVLNSGRTLAYAMSPFVKADIKKIQVAVLVNRSHTIFPILPTYTGYQMATTLSDHVEVVVDKEKWAVYLA